MSELKSGSTARSTACYLQLATNDTLRFRQTPSNLIEPNTANLKDDFVDVDELYGELSELEEPIPSLIVSSPTRDYTGVQINGHKRLRQRTT